MSDDREMMKEATDSGDWYERVINLAMANGRKHRQRQELEAENERKDRLMIELHERLGDAHVTLMTMATETDSPGEEYRLRTKAAGVALALSYVNEYRRAALAASPVSDTPVSDTDRTPDQKLVHEHTGEWHDLGCPFLVEYGQVSPKVCTCPHIVGSDTDRQGEG